MSHFLRLLSESDKAAALFLVSQRLRSGECDARVFEVQAKAFDSLPGRPFAYWVSDDVRSAYQRFKPLHNPKGSRYIWSTNPLNDDFRYARTWWEVCLNDTEPCWIPWAKGGAFSSVYFDIHTVIHWSRAKGSYFGFLGTVNRPLERPASVQYFFRPGITWPRRTQAFGPRAMPGGCIFADKGPAGFVDQDKPEDLLAILALMVSRAFAVLVELRLNAADSTARSFEVGLIQQTPVPELSAKSKQQLATLGRRAWSLKRKLDTVNETSHAFLVPAALRGRCSEYDPAAIDVELARIQTEIDTVAFDLYGFSHIDRQAALGLSGHAASDSETVTQHDESDEDGAESAAPPVDALLSWVV